MAIREKIFGAEHLEVARSLDDLAVVYLDQDQPDQAKPFAERALAIREKILGADHLTVATSLNTVAIVYFQQDDLVAAEGALQRALAIRERHLGRDHPDVAQSLHNLGALALEQGQLEKAESLVRRSLAINERVFGAGAPEYEVEIPGVGDDPAGAGKRVASSPEDHEDDLRAADDCVFLIHLRTPREASSGSLGGVRSLRRRQRFQQQHQLDS